MTSFNNNSYHKVLNYFIDEVFDTIKIGIVALRGDYSINKMNVALMKMFGYKKDDLQDRSIDILFQPDEINVLHLHIQKSDCQSNEPASIKFELLISLNFNLYSSNNLISSPVGGYKV